MNMMTFKRQEQTSECEHTSTELTSWAGLRRERCTECGNVSISFLETARTGVLFAIPRDGEEHGAALAEWGLLVVLVAVVALIAVGLTGDELSGTYDDIATTLAAT